MSILPVSEEDTVLICVDINQTHEDLPSHLSDD